MEYLSTTMLPLMDLSAAKYKLEHVPKTYYEHMVQSVLLTTSRTMVQADAVLHFGTHGSLEFMPGKQVGMSDLCYPDSLISSIPNIYYYAANNPSEATIAKRRSYANTISYLTPPAENAGLYKGLKVSQLVFCTQDAQQAVPLMQDNMTMTLMHGIALCLHFVP